MSKILDLVDKRFGRLVVIDRAGSKNGRRMWECQCDCGKVVVTAGQWLKSGNTKSCGCLKIDGIVSRSLTHGQQKLNNRTAEYRAWRHIKSRCYNPNVERYPNYGGKGIIVCDRWLNSFENFFEDMGKRPSPLHSIDRFPNITGNYEPSNCRWATRAEQARGTTVNHWIEFKGDRLILSDWATKLGTYPTNLQRMMKKKSFEEVVNYYLYNRRKRKNA